MRLPKPHLYFRKGRWHCTGSGFTGEPQRTLNDAYASWMDYAYGEVF